MSGGITLRQMAQHAAMIEVRCGRCPRAGRLSLAHLIAEHGPDTPIASAVVSLVADCPNRDGLAYERCDVFWPAVMRGFPQSHA